MFKVRVTLLDANDSPPSFSSSQYNIGVAENITTGTVVTLVKASDPDTTGRLSYKLTRGGDNRFSINQNGKFYILHD